MEECAVKATLEFNLPEEQDEFQNAVDGTHYRAACEDIENYMRDKVKYGHTYKTINDALEDVRRELRESIN